METLRIAKIVEPRSFLKTDGVHNESISIPFGSGVAVPRWAEILEILT